MVAVSAPPRVEADAARAVTRLRIVARAPLALSLDHRLIDGAKIYRITGYRDDRRFVEIDAEQTAGCRVSFLSCEGRELTGCGTAVSELTKDQRPCPLPPWRCAPPFTTH